MFATSILPDILSPSHFENRDGPPAVKIKILYCGHADRVKIRSRLVKTCHNSFPYRVLFCVSRPHLLSLSLSSFFLSFFFRFSNLAQIATLKNHTLVSGDELKHPLPLSLFLSVDFLTFSIYHVALDCLLDDKGSWLARQPHFSRLDSSPSIHSFSSGGSFYFAEPRACRRITFRCRVGFIAQTPVLLTPRYYRASLSRASVNLFEMRRRVHRVLRKQ